MATVRGECQSTAGGACFPVRASMFPLILLALVFLLALVYGPAYWVRRVMARHRQPANRYPGTGAELARHLLRRLDMAQVTVELSDMGDHYDPAARAVRLSPDNYHGRHLTAVTVAAHEVGHAIQDAVGYPPLAWRTWLVKLAVQGQRIGVAMLLAIPVLMLLTRTPAAAGLLLVAVLLSMGLAIVVHLVTLPTELDASFSRALPLLEAGYLKPEDQRAARRILTAASLTYVAAALASLLNVWVWLRLLR